jgi:hypothetical protein
MILLRHIPFLKEMTSGAGVCEVISIELLEDEDGVVVFMFSSKCLCYIHGKWNIIFAMRIYR